MKRVVGTMALSAVMLMAGGAVADEEADVPEVKPDEGMRTGRVELRATGGTMLNGNGELAPTSGGVFRYYPTDRWGIGLEGSYIGGFEQAWPEGYVAGQGRMAFGLNVAYVPFSDGFVGDSETDLYVFGAAGIISSRPVPDNFTDGVRVALSAMGGLGAGWRVYFTEWLVGTAEARADVLLFDGSPQPAGQGQLGLSIMLPFSRQRAPRRLLAEN